MIKAARVGHATFETPDLDRAITYYTDVNGLVLKTKEKGRAFLASKIGLLPSRWSRAAMKAWSGFRSRCPPMRTSPAWRRRCQRMA
jgi:hypothetical protein